jgi:type IV secretory pathway VirJ component
VRRCVLAFLALFWCAAVVFADSNPTLSNVPVDAGLLGKPRIILPTGPVRGEVFLFSDKEGWGADEDILAASLQSKQVIVVGIDTKVLLGALNARPTNDCIYLVSHIEALSHQIQRSIGDTRYQSPIIAGMGTSGAFALAIAAQTPNATIKQTVAIDPTIALPLVKPLCTDAPRVSVSGGSIYGLSPHGLKNPVDVIYTTAASIDSRAHTLKLKKQGFAIQTKDVTENPQQAVLSAVDRALSVEVPSDHSVGDLPLIQLPARASFGTIAIIYSGDGGWRDIDKSIGDVLQKEGVPTIGVDSLRYFWSKKNPDKTAKDMARIIDTYTKLWGADHVILAGYSFGADILPKAYDLLPVSDKKKIVEISLLGISSTANYQISVGAFLGSNSGDAPTLPDLRKVQAPMIQCFYGALETDSICLKLQGTGSELIKTSGGHHFDGRYDVLAHEIVNGAKRRLAVADSNLAAERY